MQEFVLFFKIEPPTKEDTLSPEQLQESIKPWQDWIGSIAAQNKLAMRGNQLRPETRIVKADKTVLNGPFADIKEVIGGFMVIRAADYEEAVETAKGCPILLPPWKGSVEVRMVADI